MRILPPCSENAPNAGTGASNKWTTDGVICYNVRMERSGFITGGRTVRSDSFIVIVSVMVFVAGAAADISVRMAALAGWIRISFAGFQPLFVAAGVVTAVGATAFSAVLLVARSGRMGSLPLVIPAGVISVGFMLNMIFALLVRGTPHMSVEVLTFIFSLIAVLAVGLTSAGVVKRTKAVIATGAMGVLSVIMPFIPYFTGDCTIAETLMCLPFAAVLGAYAFALAGTGELPQRSAENGNG